MRTFSSFVIAQCLNYRYTYTRMRATVVFDDRVAVKQCCRLPDCLSRAGGCTGSRPVIFTPRLSPHLSWTFLGAEVS